MAWTEKKLMRVLNLIDLPRHDEVVNMVRQWRIFTIVISALSGVGIWFLLFDLTRTKSVNIVVALPVIFFAILIKLIFVDDDFKTPDNEVVGGGASLVRSCFWSYYRFQ